MSYATRIDTIFVPALDTEAAARWYASMFGMVEIFRSAGHIGLRFEGASAKTTALTLVPVSVLPEQGFVAFNFFSSEPEALHDALLEDGRDVTPITDSGGLIWFDFTDIAGNRVNVCHFRES
jgi:catechol 2,3-dioxygenase-like lactoylglutathione lyase family enzyme